MSGNTTQRKKRKQQKQGRTQNAKWTTSYSTMAIQEAELRLGFQPCSLTSILVEDMLANVKHKLEGLDRDIISSTKEKVYDRIVEYLEVEGPPTQANSVFKGANVSDLVYSIISPIIRNSIRMTGRSLQLAREKEIISTDNETGGMEEFVVTDKISLGEENFVLVIEGKRGSVGEALKQCSLSMKDIRDNNGGGEVYGFVTTGDTWRMLRNDGTSFQISDKMDVLFGTMGRNQEKWMKDYSVLVDCMFVALSNGGVLTRELPDSMLVGG